jgi:rhodanese-related sulfurtransferase/rubrerythrin
MEEQQRLFAPVRALGPEQARTFIAEHQEGTFTLLDVRQPPEYEAFHIPGAKLIPLPQLNQLHGELDARKPTIVYCASGGRSRVAAQFLEGHGFQEVYNLEGGVYSWEGLEAVGPQEMNLDLVRGDESPAEIVTLAYRMEEGLRAFYEAAAGKVTDRQVADLLDKLVKVEEVHKQRLWERSSELASTDSAVGPMGSGEGSRLMEGGFDLEAFMKQNEAFLGSVTQVLELAIMLESQALDLYMRFADKSRHEPTKEVLFAIAQEEKGHLAILGKLLDEKSERTSS